MYEIREQQRKQMREHRFFYHFILVIGIFVFAQGCQLMTKNPGYSASAAILGIMLQRHSVDKVFIRIFKFDPHKNARIALMILLCIIALFSYFKRFGFTFFLLLDLSSIILFAATAFIYQKLKTRQE